MSETTQAIMSIYGIIGKAKLQEIDRRRCFIVSRSEFNRYLDIHREMGWNMETDDRIAANGYDNVNLMLTTGDKGGVYFVCTAAEPALDRIWQEKMNAGKT